MLVASTNKVSELSSELSIKAQLLEQQERIAKDLHAQLAEHRSRLADNDTKQLQEEITKLRSLSKSRDQIL